MPRSPLQPQKLPQVVAAAPNRCPVSHASAEDHGWHACRSSTCIRALQRPTTCARGYWWTLSAASPSRPSCMVCTSPTAYQHHPFQAEMATCQFSAAENRELKSKMILNPTCLPLHFPWRYPENGIVSDTMLARMAAISHPCFRGPCVPQARVALEHPAALTSSSHTSIRNNHGTERRANACPGTVHNTRNIGVEQCAAVPR